MSGIKNTFTDPVHIAGTLIHTGTDVLSADSSSVELLGISGKTGPLRICDLQIPGYEKLLDELKKSKEPFAVLDHVVKSGGSGRRLLLRTTRMPDDSGLFHLHIAAHNPDHLLLEAEVKVLREEQKILYREIHHRVKNNMQIILSLLKLQATGPGGNAAAAELMKSRNRIQSMALVHEHVYSSGRIMEVDMQTYAEWLVQYLFRSYNINRENISCNISLTGISLPVDLAVNCGLILNELLSNAVRHAFPSQKGEIHIAGNRNAEGQIRLTISDNGCGLPDDFDIIKAKTLGFQIIHSLVAQIDGTIEKKFGNGCAFVIIFTP